MLDPSEMPTIPIRPEQYGRNTPWALKLVLVWLAVAPEFVQVGVLVSPVRPLPA